MAAIPELPRAQSVFVSGDPVTNISALSFLRHKMCIYHVLNFLSLKDSTRNLVQPHNCIVGDTKYQ